MIRHGRQSHLIIMPLAYLDVMINEHYNVKESLLVSGMSLLQILWNCLKHSFLKGNSSSAGRLYQLECNHIFQPISTRSTFHASTNKGISNALKLQCKRTQDARPTNALSRVCDSFLMSCDSFTRLRARMRDAAAPRHS